MLQAVHEDVLQILVAVQSRLLWWRESPRNIERILIIKLDRIGDMVTTTPVFDALLGLFPNARLDLVGHPGALSLLEGDARLAKRMPYRSSLYHSLPLWPAGPQAWWLVLKLLWRRYPLVVYLRGSPVFLWLGLTSRLAAAKFREGEPVIDRYLKPLESLWGPIATRQPRLQIDRTAARFAEELLFGGKKEDCPAKCKGTVPFCAPRIAIHATASAPTKIWPPERFASLADQLTRSLNAHVHFLGGPADKPHLDRIACLAALKHAYHSSLPLPQVVALIAACDLFIGNDSGLAHIAAAVNTRMVVLWGPVNLSMARPKAPPERCTILYHDLACRPVCPEHRCVNPVHLECLMRIDAGHVLEAVRHLLGMSPNEDGRAAASTLSAAAAPQRLK